MVDKYLDFVQETAKLHGKVFFLDSGEGKDWGQPDSDWYVEELSGWLVDINKAEVFRQKLKEKGKEWAWASSYTYCWVKWDLKEDDSSNGPPVTVKFVPVDEF